MKKTAIKWTRFRLGLVLAMFILALGIILWRAFNLQVLERDRLAGIADREAHKIVKINPLRGVIYDRNGEKLAVSLEADSLFIQPGKIENPGKAAGQLSSVLGIEKSLLLKKMKSDAAFVWIKRQVEPDLAERVKALELPGLGLIKENKRFYPNNVLAAHLLGFAGVDNQGLEGLELGCDKYLRGGVNEWRVKRDALGRTFLDRRAGAPEPNRGADVILTIDRRIQYIAESALVRAVQKHQAKGGLALVVRPKTGEILASVVVPGFNPNCFSKYQASQRRNRIVTDTFDPGSTFKVFVVAGALEENLIKPNDKFFCENGSFKIGGRVVHDHLGYGWLTVNKVLQKSSNIGTVKIGRKLGRAKMYEYLKRFSFGERTGIDFPVESPGLVRPYKKWRQIDTANIAFGQGVTVTALQMVMAMSALANDGLLMRPYVVAEITGDSGRVIKRKRPQAIRQVISPETSRLVRRMLRMVVEEGGTGTRADSLGYPAAGKTGTAQKLDIKTKRYSDKKFFGSFVGFVPERNPELTILVALDEPRPHYYGGLVAAPVFREIAEQALPLLNVAPVGSRPLNLIPDPEMTAPFKEARAVLEDRKRTNRIRVKLNLETSRAVATLAKQLREEETAHFSNSINQKLEIPDPSERYEILPGIMPDLNGLSMRRVMEVMSRYPFNCTFSGSGLAVWQTPAPGQNLADDTRCRIKFEQW